MPVEVLGLYVERKGVRKQQIQRRRDVARCIRTEICRGMQRGSAATLKVIVFHQVYPFGSMHCAPDENIASKGKYKCMMYSSASETIGVVLRFARWWQFRYLESQ